MFKDNEEFLVWRQNWSSVAYNFEIHLKIKYITNFSETLQFCRELAGESNKKKISEIESL